MVLKDQQKEEARAKALEVAKDAKRKASETSEEERKKALEIAEETKKNAVEIAEEAKLKMKYGSSIQYNTLEELKNQIATFIDETTCCGEDLNIGYDSSIPSQKKLFLDILKRNYAKMADDIYKNTVPAKTIVTVKNYVAPENIKSHMEKYYMKSITNIFKTYMTFIKNFTAEIKKNKILFYTVVPIARNVNDIMGNVTKE